MLCRLRWEALAARSSQQIEHLALSVIIHRAFHVNMCTSVQSAPRLLSHAPLVASLCSGVKIAQRLKASTPGDGKLKAFAAHLAEQAGEAEVAALREEVEAFASDFPMPGL